MKLKTARPNQLTDKTERATAKLALKAMVDTYHGGCNALIIGKRLDRMGSKLDGEKIVTDIYHDRDSEYIPYECPECGSVHLGADKAANCCNDIESSEDFYYDEDNSETN